MSDVKERPVSGITHRILFMRHPETIANTQGFLSGRRDVPLTENGVIQRDRAVEALVAFMPDRIWTSPLSRCRDMGQMAAQRLGLTLEVKNDLAEIDFGILEGVSFAEARTVLAPYGLTFPWGSDEQNHSQPAPYAESYEAVRIRCQHILDELIALDGRTVCLTHGGYLRCMMGQILKTPANTACGVHLANTSSVYFTSNSGNDLKLGGFNLDPQEVIYASTTPSIYDSRNIWGVHKEDA